MADLIDDAPIITDPGPPPVDATTIRYQIQARTQAGDLYTVYILDNEFTGAATNLDASEVMLRIRKGEEDGIYKTQPIPTTIDLFISDVADLSALFGGPDRRFRAVIYKGDTLFMTGWLLPDFYEQDPYSPLPETKLTIADGLHLLQDRSMDDVLQEAVSVADRGATSLTVFEEGPNVNEDPSEWYRVRDVLWALLPKGRAVEGRFQFTVTVDAGETVQVSLDGLASPATTYDSGDGQTATGSEAAFTYEEAGTYTVTLGPASLSPTLPLDVVAGWWAADTAAGSNLASTQTEPFSRFLVSREHFLGDDGIFSAQDGLRELCDLAGADFQQVPRADGAAWLFRQRSVFAGAGAPVVEFSFSGVIEDQSGGDVEVQVVDSGPKDTIISATDRETVVGDEAVFTYPFGFDYRITLGRELDLDAQVWRYEDNVLTPDSPSGRTFGLTTDPWRIDIEHTEQYERRLGSVVAVYHHEELGSVFVGGDFEDESFGEWDSGPNVDREIISYEDDDRVPDATTDNRFLARTIRNSTNQRFSYVVDHLQQATALPSATEALLQISFKGTHEAPDNPTTGRPFWQRLRVRADSAGVTYALGRNAIEIAPTDGTGLKGEGSTLELTSPVEYRLPVGTKIPVQSADELEQLDSSLFVNDYVATMTLEEPAEVGGTTLVGDLDGAVDFDDLPDDFAYATLLFWDTEDALSDEIEPGEFQYRGIYTTAWAGGGQPFDFKDYEFLIPTTLPDGETLTHVDVGLCMFDSISTMLTDNITVGYPDAPDKTVAVSSTELEGDSEEISVSSGSGPLRDSPRRLLWARQSSGPTNAIRVQGVLVGTATGSGGPPLGQVQAEALLQQHVAHTRTLNVTTTRRRGEPLIRGDEIISYDNQLWTVQMIETEDWQQRLKLVALQEAPTTLSTTVRLTDDVDKVRVDTGVDFGSRR